MPTLWITDYAFSVIGILPAGLSGDEFEVPDDVVTLFRLWPVTMAGADNDLAGVMADRLEECGLSGPRVEALIAYLRWLFTNREPGDRCGLAEFTIGTRSPGRTG